VGKASDSGFAVTVGVCDWVQSEKGERLIMKMKKLVALGAAAAMSMTMCVNVFAAATAKVTVAEDKNSISLPTTDLVDATATKQWTVLLIDKANESENITDAMILYINQGTNGAEFWSNMGTKTTLTAGNTYVLRVGGEDITTSDTGTEKVYYEYEFTPESDISLGDVNFDGKINLSDVLATLDHYLEVKLLDGDALLAADVAPKGAVDGKVNLSDVLAILDHYLEVSTIE
jgi:opacity protein-like surface antigen